MATAFTYTYDTGVRSLVYSRFGSILGITTLDPDPTQCVNKGVILCPKGIAQRYISEKRGKTFLEFINIHLANVVFDWKRQRTSVARTGLRYQKNDGSFGRVKADPITLTYNAWFWSNSLDKVRQCMEKYIQWQQETPKITLYYDNEFEFNPDLHFSGIADESHIEDLFNTGKIWVYRMPITVDGWLFKSGSISAQIQKIKLTTYDKDSVENYTEIAVADGNQDVELTAALKMFQFELYGIVDVNTSLKTFTVSKDRTLDFTAGEKFIVENSTANDEMYTVVSTAFSSEDDTTAITVLEVIPDSTVDGNIYKHEVNS